MNEFAPTSALSAGKMLTPIEAAEFVGLTNDSLANLRWKGGGPIYFKVGRYVRYDPADLTAWMRSRRYTSTSQEAAA